MGTLKPSSLVGITVLAALASLTACAARRMQGDSAGVAWSVSDLTTSERTATAPGYKGDGRAKDYRYVMVLRDSRGVGVTFREVESIIMVGAGFTPTPRTRTVNLRLPPNDQLRLVMTDSVWTVLPQWFEGTAKPVNLDPVARKVFLGTDDHGEPVKLILEFRLEGIPLRDKNAPPPRKELTS